MTSRYKKRDGAATAVLSVAFTHSLTAEYDTHILAFFCRAHSRLPASSVSTSTAISFLRWRHHQPFFFLNRIAANLNIRAVKINHKKSKKKVLRQAARTFRSFARRRVCRDHHNGSSSTHTPHKKKSVHYGGKVVNCVR